MSLVSSRFEILDKLGEGGMGIVYEAFDRERRMNVALKTLRQLDAASLYRFKREFRAVSDLSHPNIISLYELVSDEDRYFFTMEVVRGRDIIEFVRVDSPPPEVAVSGDSDWDIETADMSVPEIALPPAVALPAFGEVLHVDDLVDMDRLRRAFGQLAAALHVLHETGIVHRDLKPPNVQVTENGRVVLMDFGVATEKAEESNMPRSNRAVGTPSFMAPEQIKGIPPTAAADWYGFGVILYLALSGRLPFVGGFREILKAKLSDTPAPLEDLVTGVPEELSRLCNRLLAISPDQRPGADEILPVFDAGEPDRTRDVGLAREQIAEDVFVGREIELGMLHRAYASARAGAQVWIFVSGESGMGKSTLVGRFLSEIEDPPDSPAAVSTATDGKTPDNNTAPLFLAGRCHERESLSYNAFDGVIDNLSHTLGELPQPLLDMVLPPDIAILARLFPVLGQIPGVVVGADLDEVNPRELRSRAADSLQSLFVELSQLRPLVIHIDDVQWADGDSLALLSRLSILGEQVEKSPRLLLIGTVRTKKSEAGSWQLLDEISVRGECYGLTLGPLSEPERGELIAKLAAIHPEATRVDDAVWADAGGSPLLLVELFRYIAESGDAGETRSITVEKVLFQRIERLSGDARALLEATCVAGEAIPLQILAGAAGLDAEVGERSLSFLRASNLVRVVRPGPEQWMSAYHERVRDAVLGHLPDDEQTAIHRRLAEHLDDWDQASLGTLALHWHAAGDVGKARRYMIEAAEVAQDKLAFDRAAELYKLAFSLGEGEGEDEFDSELLSCLGMTLQLAGRSYEAALTYERAALTVSSEDALELERLAADNWLRSGHMRRGLDRLARVLGKLGARYPRTYHGALVSLGLQRLRLRWRGRDYEKAEPGTIAERDLARLDTLYAAASTLGFIDHLRGAVIQTRHLLWALELGDEFRVWRALAIESAYRAVASGTEAGEALSAEVLAHARELPDPYLVGIIQMLRGGMQFFTGRATEAIETLRESDVLLTHLRHVVEWERVTGRYLFSLAQIALGDLPGVAATVERYAATAERRNDVYARVMFLCIPSTWTYLTRDEPDEAERNLETATAGWPDDAYYVADYVEAFSRVLIRLYTGDGQEALDLMTATLPRVRRLMLTQIEWVKCEVHMLIARAALQLGNLRRARKAMRIVSGSEIPFMNGAAALIEAALAAQQDQSDRAEEFLDRAMGHFESAAAAHMVAACRIRLGQFKGDDALVELGEDDLRQRGVVSVERMLNLLAPGFSS